MNIKHILIALTCTISLYADAETVEWKDYQIHYTAFSSMLIPADVAKAHNIVRSRRRIVTNISVRKADSVVAAKLEGRSTNLFGQIFNMEFDEVIETGAIYYLSNQLIDERDTLNFEIVISPDDSESAYNLKFKRQYF
ncbi:MAG: hypothetical protein ACI9CE_001082 [Flavobacterium sp.]|jgi:hypothetical protein